MTIEGGHRTYVGKESKLLTHGEQPLFRSHLGSRVIIILQVAHSGEEDSIGTQADIVSGIGIRIANGLNSMCTTDCLLVGELVVELSCNGIEHGDALSHDFRAYSIARQDGNIQFHILLFFVMSLKRIVLFVLYDIQHLEGSLDGCFSLVGIKTSCAKHTAIIIPGDDSLYQGIGTSTRGNTHLIILQQRERAVEVLLIDIAQSLDKGMISTLTLAPGFKP